MKIIFFNYKEVEDRAVEKWKKGNPDVNLLVLDKDLSEETKDSLIGADAVCISQIKAIPDHIYDFAKINGVKIFSTRSAGIDMYNIDKLKELGIRLSNVPSYSPNAIAEYAVTAALTISRKFDMIRRNVQNFNFSWEKRLLAREFPSLRVGIMGTGRIGSQAAKLFKGLGAKVIGYDLYPNDNAKKYLDYVDSVEELAKNSDIVSLHMPSTKENYHIVNEDFLNLMPKNSILINSGRGSLVDTQALLKSLDNKQLLGAALDVYEFEGPYIPKNMKGQEIDDKVFLELIQREDILYTPHTAYFTETAVESLVEQALNSSKNYLKTGDDPLLVEL